MGFRLLEPRITYGLGSALPSAMPMSVRLLAVRRRQRSPARNLGAERAVDILAKQLGQLFAHAVRHAAFDWLHGATITTVEKFFDRRHARRLALGIGGKPCQLSNRLGAVLLGQLLDLGGDLVGGALLRPEPGRRPPLLGREPPQLFLLICGSTLLIFASTISTSPLLLTSQSQGVCRHCLDAGHPTASC